MTKNVKGPYSKTPNLSYYHPHCHGKEKKMEIYTLKFPSVDTLLDLRRSQESIKRQRRQRLRFWINLLLEPAD